MDFSDLFFYRKSAIPQQKLLKKRLNALLRRPGSLSAIEDEILTHIVARISADELEDYTVYSSIETLRDSIMYRIIVSLPRTSEWFNELIRYIDIRPKEIAILRLCKSGKGIVDERVRLKMIEEYALIFPELEEYR